MKWQFQEIAYGVQSDSWFGGDYPRQSRDTSW